jgi:hypothetical protein
MCDQQIWCQELSRKAERRRNERMDLAQRKHGAFNLIIEQLIAALDKLAVNKVV